MGKFLRWLKSLFTEPPVKPFGERIKWLNAVEVYHAKHPVLAAARVKRVALNRPLPIDAGIPAAWGEMLCKKWGVRLG